MKHLLYFFVLVQRLARAGSQHCPSFGSQSSISGWMVQRHIYKTMPSDLGLRCLVECRTDDRCQSFNFVLSRHMCEFSDRTKEASPEDFIPDSDRYYFTRKKGRGKNFTNVRSCFDPLRKRKWTYSYCCLFLGHVVECLALRHSSLQKKWFFPRKFCQWPFEHIANLILFPVPLGSTALLAAISCKEIKASEGESDSGKYWLSGLKPNVMVFAFCDMNTGGRCEAQYWQGRKNAHKCSFNDWILIWN